MNEDVDVISYDENYLYKIKKNYPINIIYSLEANSLEIEKIMNYFRKIKIDVINELLVFNLTIFLLTFKEVKETFEKYDIDELVAKINDDYLYIEQIF